MKYDCDDREGFIKSSPYTPKELDLSKRDTESTPFKEMFADCRHLTAEEMAKALKPKEETSDATNPNHYKGTRCLDEMRLMFGVEQVKSFCRLNIFKYRWRAEDKNGQEDLDKADWYMNYLEGLEKENA